MQKTRSFAIRLNVLVLRIARHWLRIALTILAIYISLPWIAPTLMRFGLTAPANVIYNLYTPFCHQFAFRSLFLYGEQPAYPLASTGSSLKPFEAYVSQSAIPEAMAHGKIPQPPFNVAGLVEFQGVNINGQQIYLTLDENLAPEDDSLEEARGFIGLQVAAHNFVGNDAMGYKMTLCARDIAIYVALFVGGLIYSIPAVQRRLRPVPLHLYFILGVMPIGLDGFSQLLGYPPFNLWPPRETVPEFRVLTGFLFGIMNAWLGFPYIRMSMEDTRLEIEAKLREAGIHV